MRKARELAPPEEPPEFVARIELDVGRIDAIGKAVGNRGAQRRKEPIDEWLRLVALRRAHAEVDDVDLDLCEATVRERCESSDRPVEVA